MEDYVKKRVEEETAHQKDYALRQQARALFKMGPLSAGARGPGISDWIVASDVSSSMLKKKGMSVSCARLRGQSDPAPRPSS